MPIKRPGIRSIGTEQFGEIVEEKLIGWFCILSNDRFYETIKCRNDLTMLATLLCNEIALRCIQATETKGDKKKQNNNNKLLRELKTARFFKSYESICVRVSVIVVLTIFFVAFFFFFVHFVSIPYFFSLAWMCQQNMFAMQFNVNSIEHSSVL